VDQQERGVVLRVGKFAEVVLPGLHWNPPLIDEVAKINVTKVQSHSSRGTMLTQDENIVDIALSVQYIIANPRDFYLNVRDPELSLTHATDSALRHVVGGSTMDSVLTEGRELLATDVQARLQEYLTSYGTGLQISRVNIEDAQAPKEVQAAFDDVIKAKEDEQRVKNEAQAYANGIIPVARGNAKRLYEESIAYKAEVISRAEGEADRFVKLLAEYKKAPQVTRERMYLDAIQTVYSQTNKVMVDVEGGNNLLYLPLDKLTQSSSSGSSSVTGMGGRDLENLTNQVIEKIRERQNNTRTREGR
jgi:membrane protease subunit HflK